MSLDQPYWQERLNALVDKHGIVGASLAVAHGDHEITAATGVLNARTGQPATTESVFQIGSITKVWTATLVMQLVDDGLLDLDAPLITYLPDFRVADDALTQQVTTRHLLAHTSGIAGDFFPETGRGDDCLERFVTLMAELRKSHPLGATMSYCNAGYVLLGRLVEVLRAATWDQVMRERLFQPLGLEAAGTLPEEALLWGAATGHITPPGAPEPIVSPQWGLSSNAGPAGLIHARARDLLAFARMHLAEGLAPDGTRVLSAESARAMRVPQVEVPDRWTFGGHWGLGWILPQWDGRVLFAHDGSTIGQSAYLRVLPGEPDLVVALLTNGGETRELYQDLFGEVFEQLAGVTITPRVEPVSQPPAFDPAQYVGRYERESMAHEVELRGEELVMVNLLSGILATAMGADRVESPLLPYDTDVFLTSMPSVSGYLPAVFYTAPDGNRYLHLAGRAAAKV
ncbi:MAG: beta-lactamase [Frankiales bacterium]|nr:beta-lactamase [Frankiales bacterium]